MRVIASFVAFLLGSIAPLAASAPFVYVVGHAPGDGRPIAPPGALRVFDVENARWTTDPISIPDWPIAVARTHGNAKVVTLHFQGYGPGALKVLSVPDSRVIATVPVAQYPRAFALSPDERRAYVLSEQGLTEIDLVTAAVVRERPWSASTLAVSPDGRTLFIGGTSGVSAISALDFSTHDVAPVAASVLVVSRDGERLYVVIPDDWITAAPVS